ncbi:MAG: hypothetical protein WA060_01800 [Minisyncoccia bacterium]
MRKIIHHIRRQPDHVKKHILHIFTAVSAVVLVLLWVYSLGTNFTDTSTEAKVDEDLKPFSALKANLIDGYYSLGETQ